MGNRLGYKQKGISDMASPLKKYIGVLRRTSGRDQQSTGGNEGEHKDGVSKC